MLKTAGRWCLQGLHDVPDEQSWQETIRSALVALPVHSNGSRDMLQPCWCTPAPDVAAKQAGHIDGNMILPLSSP